MQDIIFNEYIELKNGAKIRLLSIIEESDKAIGVETTETICHAIDGLAETIKQQIIKMSVTGLP